jgi:hypothetical protein
MTGRGTLKSPSRDEADEALRGSSPSSVARPMRPDERRALPSGRAAEVAVVVATGRSRLCRAVGYGWRGRRNRRSTGTRGRDAASALSPPPIPVAFSSRARSRRP